MYVIAHLDQLRQLDQKIKTNDFNKLETTQKEIKELIGNEPCARTPWAMVFAVFFTMLSVVGPYILWFEIITGDHISTDNENIIYKPELLIFILVLITAVHYLAKGFYHGLLALAGIWFMSFCIAVSGSLITLFNYEHYITSGGVALSSMGMIFGSLSFLLFNRKTTYKYILFAYHNRILRKK
ncbi:hypothetical protein [Pantoea sp. A4]|uniref:hypothetical protein n=1 Tax=Pantoea sp. A4 TaxID=1225184 RepID=UPI000378EA01|nr:hypothetical protein [Pantoea sp. A4]